MPVRGPKPKPEALKKVSARSHKKKTQSMIIDFPIPDELSALPQNIRLEVEEIWSFLITNDIANPIDRGAFCRYIELKRICDEAAKDMDERGMIIRAGTARERVNPSWRIFKAASSEALKIEEQFGLTPSARRRLPLTPKEEANGYAARRRTKASNE